MNAQKVWNPNTKRSINAHGATASKIYKQYLKGDIQIRPEDLVILKAIYDKNPTLSEQLPNKSPKSIKLSSKILFRKLSDFKNIHPVITQGTSKIYNGTFENDNYYIKEVIKSSIKSTLRRNVYGIYDIELAFNEVLASVLYTDIYKVDAIKLVLVVNDTEPKMQKYLIASKAVDIDTCAVISLDCELILQNKIEGVIEPFLVDCILANWDVGSRGNVGIIKEEGRKSAFRIDVGGSLLFRALGQKRLYDNIPTEHNSFFNPTNKGYKLFSNLKRNQVIHMFDLIEKLDLNKFITLKTSLSEMVNHWNLPHKDKKMAIKVLESIDIVMKRHEYYIDNKPSIIQFLQSQVKFTRKI